MTEPPAQEPSRVDEPPHPDGAPTSAALTHLDADASFLGLRGDAAAGRFHFTVADHLSRLDARLYGGTAIAVSIAAAEQTTGRPAVWMTTQFVAAAARGAAVEVDVEVLAPGRRTSQVRVTGTEAGGDIVFASLGATGAPRDDGLTGEFTDAPAVDDPDAAERWATPFTGLARAAGVEAPVGALPRGTSSLSVIEIRHARPVEGTGRGPGRLSLWIRRRDGAAITPAFAAFSADMVPLSIAHAFGILAAGTSLDNTMRLGSFTAGEWILLDLHPHAVVGGYGHGTAHIWSEDGRLLATATQTASMRPFDLSHVVQRERR